MYNVILLSKDRDYKELIESYFNKTEYEIKGLSRIEELKEKIENESIDVLICDLAFGSVSIAQIKRVVADSRIIVMALNDSFDNIDLEVYLKISIREFINKKEDIKLLEQRIANLIKIEEIDGINKKSINNERVIIDKSHQFVQIEDEVISVTRLEMELIDLLIKNKNMPISREEIFKKVWYQEKGNIRKVDTCIKNIRKKLSTRSIKSIYGKGYVWKE